MMLRWILVLSLSIIVAACGSNNKQTLGQLKYKGDKEREIEFEKVTHEEVRNEYKELIDLFEDDELKEQIERRIADVYMMEGVEKQATATRQKSHYVEAIKAYRNVLEKYPDSPDNAEVFYQLAKAYDMEGQQEEAMKMLTELVQRHPNYKNISEVHFRKADIHFNWGEYKEAKASYLAVTRLSQNRLLLNAYYMLGWVYYKEYDFEASINSFAFVMNSILTESRDFTTLDKAEKPLVEDSIHSISLALDKVGGAEMIGQFPSIAERDYTWRLYDHLGDYYLEKELYEQSAKTFRQYVTNFPTTEIAPKLHEKLINAYTKGKFVLQALVEKEHYVKAYGIHSSYPGNANGIDASILALLKVYIDELANFYYGEGQAQQDVAKKELERNGERADKKKIAKNESGAVESYLSAAAYFGEYIETFPKDARVDEMRFLKAEAFFLAGDFLNAAKDYELVAYSPQGTSAKDKAADSGYAAIISYQKQIDGLLAAKKAKGKQQEVANLRGIAVESMLRFSKTFDSDERSPSVLTNAAEYLFGLDQYERAIQVAEDLINTNKNLDKTLKKTAYGILAHSHFKLENFADAKQAYIAQRSLTKSGGEEYNKISERIAASTFKNAESIEKNTGKVAAAEELLTLKSLSPNSPIRITAQYDAATLLLGVEAWKKAIVELREMKQMFPNHKLAVEFPRKLALAYEKDKQWANAASEYLGLYKNDPDANIQREALFFAATMFENNKQYEEAITYFKKYAYDYEEPFDTRMEARYRLAVNYKTLGDIGKQLYWLRRIIDGDAEAGEKRTERSQWLGAWANAQYGDYFLGEFEKTRLYVPLPKSLPKKQEFFQDANDRYQKAASYGILEFVTMSSYKIGVLNETFAKDLRNAPRPGGLSKDDVEVYKEIINEQAAPFDQLAVEVHQTNIDKAWEGHYNEWIEKSFAAIKRLYPERYAKEEVLASYGEEIR